MIPPRHPKTPNTAVVLIPPQELWEPIQAIRRVHDLHVERWMPHVTLLFPFAPAERFAQAEPDLGCRRRSSRDSLSSTTWRDSPGAFDLTSAWDRVRRG
jgi:hypothetical protein